jgi:hypothetical protein
VAADETNEGAEDVVEASPQRLPSAIFSSALWMARRH